MQQHSWPPLEQHSLRDAAAHSHCTPPWLSTSVAKGHKNHSWAIGRANATTVATIWGRLKSTKLTPACYINAKYCDSIGTNWYHILAWHRSINIVVFRIVVDATRKNCGMPSSIKSCHLPACLHFSVFIAILPTVFQGINKTIFKIYFISQNTPSYCF